MPNTITAATPFPFTITRNLWTLDAEGNEDILLEGVRITFEACDWSPDVVDEAGFTGDYCVHLLDDVRFAGLTEEQVETALDSACNLVERVASTLSRGESISAHAEDARAWHYKGYRNA